MNIMNLLQMKYFSNQIAKERRRECRKHREANTTKARNNQEKKEHKTRNELKFFYISIWKRKIVVKNEGKTSYMKYENMKHLATDISIWMIKWELQEECVESRERKKQHKHKTAQNN